jgi:predicted MFS family arabinose efflux permease
MSRQISATSFPMIQDTGYTAYRWLMLLCVSFSICAYAMEMTGFAPILGIIAEDLNVQIGEAANLMMVYVLAVAFSLTWAGSICDRYGITTALVSGILCSCVPAVMMPLVTGHAFKIFIVLRFIQGVSVGFIYVTVGHVLARWFPPKERGIASGLMIGAMPIGASIGVATAPILLEMIGSWRYTMVVLSIPGWLGVVLAILITRRQPQSALFDAVIESKKPDQKEMSFLQALKFPYTWIGVCIMFCNAWCHFCLYSIIPPFLSANAPIGVGLSPILAGKLSLAITLSGFFAFIAGGLFFDRVAKGNYRFAMIIGFFLTGISSYFILTSTFRNGIFPLVLCLLFAGWGTPFMNGSISSCIVANYPAPIVGRMMGVWFGLGTFGGALGIYLGGIGIAKTGNFYWAIFPISIAATIGIVFSWFLKFKNAYGVI